MTYYTSASSRPNSLLPAHTHGRVAAGDVSGEVSPVVEARRDLREISVQQMAPRPGEVAAGQSVLLRPRPSHHLVWTR